MEKQRSMIATILFREFGRKEHMMGAIERIH
jgi:hypothetical protein